MKHLEIVDETGWINKMANTSHLEMRCPLFIGDDFLGWMTYLWGVN